MTDTPQVFAILLAAGSGRRVGHAENKTVFRHRGAHDFRASGPPPPLALPGSLKDCRHI